MTKEIWKRVPGWSNYMVSNKGHVKSLGVYRRHWAGGRRWIPGRTIGTFIQGRVVVTLCKPGSQITYGVAELVLRIFVRPPKDGEIARHYHNPDPYDCCVENLRWGTPSDNQADFVRHTGKHFNSKLAPDQVREIRHLLAGGQIPQKDIASQFGVSKATITMIKKGQSQKLVPE